VTVEFRVYFVIQRVIPMFYIMLMLQQSRVGSNAVITQDFSYTVSVFHCLACDSCDVYNY